MTMRERIARAIEDAEIGYEMKLVSLINGISTYRLRYSDGEVFDFGSTDEVYEHIANRKRRKQAEAVLDAIGEPTEAMIAAGCQRASGFASAGNRMCNGYRAMIDAAKAEGEA